MTATPETSPVLRCPECLGAGYRTVDGKPSACPNCETGTEWANANQQGERYPSPNNLPPGGEVLVREAARAAAGLPVGAIGGDVPVRAMLVRDELLVEALGHVTHLIADARSESPPVKEAQAFLERLPVDYKATLPVVTRRRSRRGRGDGAPTAPPAKSGAAPLAPPSS